MTSCTGGRTNVGYFLSSPGSKKMMCMLLHSKRFDWIFFSCACLLINRDTATIRHLCTTIRDRRCAFSPPLPPVPFGQPASQNEKSVTPFAFVFQNGSFYKPCYYHHVHDGKAMLSDFHQEDNPNSSMSICEWSEGLASACFNANVTSALFFVNTVVPHWANDRKTILFQREKQAKAQRKNA